MAELCLIYNFAPKYREAIFTEIDRAWDCEWFFGVNGTDIKGMDLGVLKNATTVPQAPLRGHWYRLKGIGGLTRRKDLRTFFILGEPYCLSTWWLAVKLRLFHPSRRLYFWTHGWYGKESRVTRLVKKAFFKLAHGVFLYGNHARGLMIAEGFDANRLFVIHNSLDYAGQLALRGSLEPTDIYRRHFGNNNPTLIFIGRLTGVKRLDLLLQAAARLKADGLEVNIVMVGDGSERASLEALATELGIASNCWFYGACYDDRENAALIYNADVCVAPGNVGLTAMHTMVFGTPVISHNDFKWQMPEFEAIRPGLTGAFFEKDNVESLADAIKNWLNSADRDKVRQECYKEIDTLWTPQYQMEVLRANLRVD